MGNSVPTKALVLTVGVGRDVVRSLRLALEYHNPSQLFRKRGLRPEQVYVDYTRGTKAMSAAADYVAIDLELAGVSYITGDTDERGQVITGTERLLSFRPLDLIFRRSWRTLADLFIWSTRCLVPGCRCGLPLSPQTGPDLLAHADRRAEEHRHDVAVALLYRLMEYMAQRRLHDRGLRTDAVGLDRLPDSVQARWHARAERDGRLKLGMVQAYELLADLGDRLGARFAELYWTPDSTLRGYLEARNMSPLAHGFQPVGADVYGKLRALLTREFLPQVVADWESWLPRCQLPRLPEEA